MGVAGALAVVGCLPATSAPSPAPTRVATEGALTRAYSHADRVADSVLALMTLEEKIGQLTQTPVAANQTGPGASAGSEAEVRAGRIGSFLSFWGAVRTQRMQHVAVEQSRLHIPLIFAQDVIHGWRTVFPIPLAQAGTFDSAAVAGAARIAATEATSEGIAWTFAPMVDVARDPRWGRIAEGGGEDPYLGSVMAAAQVHGLQGDRLSDPTSLLATAKHFAAYGAAQGGRDYNIADVAERTLWEVYLPPFHRAVQAGVGSIMASFNEIGGTPAHASRWLLTDVLRRRWGFPGVVVSDWGGVEELLAHGIAADSAEAARRAIMAGVDIEMSSLLYRADLPALVRSGRVPMSVIDSAARRVLLTKARLGLFDNPYARGDSARVRREILSPAHRAAARQLAREAIVLLTNHAGADGAPVLPLRRGRLHTIAVIGVLANDARSVLGPWEGAGRPADAVTVLDGLRRALPGVAIRYVPGVAPDTRHEDTTRTGGVAAAAAAVHGADAVILVVGEPAEESGEAESRSSIELPDVQRALAMRIVRAAQPARIPVIALVESGRPLAVPWLADSASSLVQTWFLGVEHGNAVADVLLGDASPSGRLAVTIPRATGQIPIYYDHKNTGRPPEDSNKYTSKYIDLPFTPLFPFGYGLSYTTFLYGTPRLSSTSVRASEPVTVSADVTNTGTRVGDEVAQLYVRDDAASVTRPVRELKAFQRITLRPRETRTVQFRLGPDDLAFYGLDDRRLVEPGTFTVWVGGSSLADRSARFTVTGDTLVLAPAPPRMQ